VEPLSHAVQLAGAGFRGVGTEFPRRPNRQALRALELPILVVAAGRSRLHDVDAMLAEARSTGPNVATATVAGASHFTLPATDAEAVNEALLAHLDRSTT
jgi:pimeloyl-ACP methyl ester carboxylesterase